MTYYVTQPSAMPTNKLMVGSTATAVFAQYAGPVVAEIWPQVVPAVVGGPTTTEAVATLSSILAGIAVAWWVRDRAA